MSTSVFKRIWLYFDNIKFIVDKGYIFSSDKVEFFHSYESIKTDINKRYTKAQDYLAIIGGLVKIITAISNLLNYYTYQNSYYLQIIKDFIIENKISEKYILQKKSFIMKEKIIR